MENSKVDQREFIKDEQHLICLELKAIAEKMDEAATVADTGTWQRLTLRLRELMRIAQRTVPA